MTYIVKELTDTEILKKMDENAEASIQNIEEELIKSLLPAIELIIN